MTNKADDWYGHMQKELKTIKDKKVCSMISISDSLSFAKLVMMSSVPAKSAGEARSVVPYNLDSNLYQECIRLSMPNVI